MTDDQRLAHSLKMQFGLGPCEPSTSQLEAIKSDIQALRDQRIHPSHSDWQHAVIRHCPGAGMYGYSGVDNSDLNALLALTAKPPKHS